MQGAQPFIFHRTVTIEGTDVDVEVDLLAGEYSGTGKSHRTQPVQDIKARKARGCDLAFKFQQSKLIKGTLPGGAQDEAQIRVAGIVPFLVMKGMAIHDRLKEKDAYDIYYCIKNFNAGIDGLVEEFRPFLGNSLIKEGLEKISGKFASPDHFGPEAVADFNEIVHEDERESIKRDAFERVHAFLVKTGIVSAQQA